MVQIFGWLGPEAAWASRRNRARAQLLAGDSALIGFHHAGLLRNLRPHKRWNSLSLRTASPLRSRRNWRAVTIRVAGSNSLGFMAIELQAGSRRVLAFRSEERTSGLQSPM